MKPSLILLSALVVALSSHLDGAFQSAPRAVGDFNSDCGNGSEVFYGSCDFESHSCGWNDSSKSIYSWRLEMANKTSIPTQDHTTGRPWGHVMYVDGQRTGYNLEATLELPVYNMTALGCQLSFWYQIQEIRRSYTSPFMLNMVRGGRVTTLFQSKRETKGWENATVFIGNQPGGYKLLFLAKSPSFGVTDVMLDDVCFQSCGDRDIPAGSDQLSCDFEEDACSWYRDLSSSLLWERSDDAFGNRGPGYDHTTGEGYYMFIAAKDNLDASSTARLISYPQRAAQVTCVTFWYHIYGGSIGSLRFIAKYGGEEETVVWTRHGTQGNKWRFADLTFNSHGPVQFIIEAEVGGTRGSISIDDVVVTSRDEGSCPAERECTFQSSLCGMQTQRPDADASWIRTRGAQPANSSNPASDHTLGTEMGFYLSARLWSHPVGTRVAVQSAVMRPTPPTGECWMFWYHMEGDGVGRLSVHLQTLGAPRKPVQKWTRVGEQGKRWRHGRVTVDSPGGPYQVIFEAVAGSGPRRDVAIDDLTVLNGVCPPEGFCDFEMDLCGWVNSPPAPYGVDWDWLSGSTAGHFIPDVDHTTNSALGHFLHFSSSTSSVEEIAQLESETMQVVERGCLEFWHYAEAWVTNQPSYLELAVLVNESAGLRSVFTTNGHMNGTWHRARVDYSAPGDHQVVLRVTRPAGGEGSVSVDDLRVVRGVSCAHLDATPSPRPPATAATPPPTSPMDCDFERGLCDWVQETADEVDWTLNSGFQVHQPLDGPIYDHTLGNNQGVYLLLNGSGVKDGGRAALSLSVPGADAALCVGFWYYMLGPSAPHLELAVQNDVSDWLVWTRQGSQDLEWTNARVTISSSEAVKIVLKGHRNTSTTGFVAVDDVTVRKGACQDQNACGFDSGLCGFEDDAGHVGRWVRQKGAGRRSDHTYGTENGFYMTVLVQDKEERVAQLLTPEFSSSRGFCVRFWYLLQTGTSDVLSVHVRRSGALSSPLWQRAGAPSTGWEVAEVAVSSPDKFNVVFKTARDPSTNATVQLDDVSFREACAPRGGCDFESGRCSWVNVPTEEGHDWVHADGRFQGPPVDHTTQTPEGRFLLSQVEPGGHPSGAQVHSGWVQLNGESCLTLWYQMGHRDSGTLRVYTRWGPAEKQLRLQTNSSGPGWTRFSAPVTGGDPFQVLIEADSKPGGFIAVDDIRITPGPCAEYDEGFAGCSFENGTCGWTDVSRSRRFRWRRGSGATPSESTGPSADHTLGTELGWYMVAEADRGEHHSSAALRSPTMSPSSAHCTLHFYYHMYGEGIGELNVLLRDHLGVTPLWWLSGDQGDAWHHGEVLLGRTAQEFSVLFQAIRTPGRLGDVAVDDIFFSDCTLPDPQPFCPEGMFTCTNQRCVTHNRVCDFTDDCGDKSDETRCELHVGAAGRCSFESGLCSWGGSDLDTPGNEWVRERGSDAWAQHGPPRDHTQNTAAGYYALPGPYLGGTSELLSKTLLPCSNCTVRFYYYSHDQPAGARLSVRGRTQASGGGDAELWELRDQSQSYSWRRAEATFSSSALSKVVFRYERGNVQGGLLALDDVSFSESCAFASELPTDPSTSAPTMATPSTPPTNPCEDNEFFCWRSEGTMCVFASSRCDYLLDCPLGEDEDDCGPCTFERGQCKWNGTVAERGTWLRQRAGPGATPPTDHTTQTGHYMRADVAQQGQTGVVVVEARLDSPRLPPSSPYCQMLFHFHISGAGPGSLRVLMQQPGGGEATLWSRSHNTVSPWTSEHLPLGQHGRPYKLSFSSPGDRTVAVDDLSFLNCETSFQPPALSTYGCSFEDGLCGWVQGAEDDLDWRRRRSGPVDTPHAGPTGDHTTGAGQYLYIESSTSLMRNVAQLKSSLLPPVGEKGYCFTFWYHMSGASVGRLQMLLQTAQPSQKTVVWPLSGSQGADWQLAQRHVTTRRVHRVILEATAGGEAGVIAIDDVALVDGPCPSSAIHRRQGNVKKGRSTSRQREREGGEP